ncbi:hypothetical protein LTR29_007379 [Friedmanniomyces endolithicus]|nr:hypothetical protein LTR29_007379 [Friedmanniomyces endolithicus]
MVDGRHSTRRAVREGRASLVSRAEADTAVLGQCSKRARTPRNRKASDAAAQPKRKRDQADNASPAKKQKKSNPVSSPKKANKVPVAQQPVDEQAPVLQKPHPQPALAHDVESPAQIEIDEKWITDESDRLLLHPRTGSYQDQVTALFGSETYLRHYARVAREEEEDYRQSLIHGPPPPLTTPSEAEAECRNDRLDVEALAKSKHEQSAFAPYRGPIIQTCGTRLVYPSPPGDTAFSSRQILFAPGPDASRGRTTAVPAPDAPLPAPTSAVPVPAPEAPVANASAPACAVDSLDIATAGPAPGPVAPKPETAGPASVSKLLEPATAVPEQAPDPAPRAPTTSRDESDPPTAPPPSMTVPSPTYSAVPLDNEHTSPPAEDPLQPAPAAPLPEPSDPGTDVGEDFSSLFGGETPPVATEEKATGERPARLALPKPIPDPAHTSEELASPVHFVGSLPGLNLDFSRFPTLNTVKGTGKIFLPKVDKRADTDTAGPRE